MKQTERQGAKRAMKNMDLFAPWFIYGGATAKTGAWI